MSRAWILGLCVAATAAMVSAGPAWAWGDEGHEIIALIARDHLAPPVRARVDQLLAEDRDPLTAPDMAARSTWADRWRSTHPETAGWHYVDLELNRPDFYAACKRSGASCIVDKLNLFESELANSRLSDWQRVFALKMVLHLVGDLHQPLHAADSHDRGGNCERVRYTSALMHVRLGPAKVTSLHAYWDGVPVAEMGRDPQAVATALERNITPAQVSAWSRGKTEDWALESFRVARSAVYSYGGPLACVPGEATPLSGAYQDQAKAVTAQQLSRAGIRLATVLNRALSAGR
ncbi:MAG TPA: S1/P1 nuclease [Phenylobacterium sp.]|uniref:S1/P1 nuclease n=1 Tax=Phenylobacterium sp. TaxID=1871053 RepID=UPI002B482EF7|nr:S1/P1 nuclease [Phenylobacterium sp.]HKR87002.1 S1/P1 nuclease [Phenylobacterium sp.]